MSVFTVHRGARPSADDASAGLSVLAPGFRVIGTVECDGTVKIEGHLDGDIHVGQQLLVASSGVIVGNVHADEVIVAGRVEGDIVASARIVLQPGSDVRGDLTAPVVAVEEGGRLNGRLRAARQDAAAAPEEPLRMSA